MSELLYEGKAKQMWSTEDENVLSSVYGPGYCTQW